MCDVVCVEERDLGRPCKSSSSEHFDVSPGDEEDGGAAELRGGDGVDGLVAVDGDDGVGREERCEVLGDADGADTGATSTVRTASDQSAKRIHRLFFYLYHYLGRAAHSFFSFFLLRTTVVCTLHRTLYFLG